MGNKVPAAGSAQTVRKPAAFTLPTKPHCIPPTVVRSEGGVGNSGPFRATQQVGQVLQEMDAGASSSYASDDNNSDTESDYSFDAFDLDGHLNWLRGT
jgi:hypothetical protein